MGADMVAVAVACGNDSFKRPRSRANESSIHAREDVELNETPLFELLVATTHAFPGSSTCGGNVDCHLRVTRRRTELGSATDFYLKRAAQLRRIVTC